MFYRYLVAIGLAILTTFAVFYGMQSLIAGGEGVMSDPAKGSVLDFVRVKKETQVEKKERKPTKPPAPKEPPPPMEQPQMDSPTPDMGHVATNFSADVQADVGLQGGLSLDTADGEYLPIVKVAPVYPRRAAQRGIEGYVIVEFTVTKLGTVSTPLVVEAKPEGIFNQAALNAAAKFKYKPRVINGEPTAVAGVQNRISFEMAQ